MAGRLLSPTMRKLVAVSALLLLVGAFLYHLKTNETYWGDHWGDPG